MSTHTITLQLPEMLYARLVKTAQATKRPLDDVLLHAVKVGSPPRWDDVPAEFQLDLAALDRLDDQALWQIARGRQSEKEVERHHLLLEKNGTLSTEERDELKQWRSESNRFMLRKAQAAALLQWRGHLIPPAKDLLNGG